MARFRSNIKRAARRALCTLLIIIAPSLAELHWAAATASPAVRQSQPLGDTASAGDLAAFSQASQLSKPNSDADRSLRNGRQADSCGLCAALDTANALLFGPPPLLLLPQMLEFLQQATDAEFAHLKSIGLSSHRPTRPAS
jgi:hypothetical protein